ncbi:MAG: hypothetical protein ACRDRI_02275 [Pseudonocardiaceae bacterium]
MEHGVIVQSPATTLTDHGVVAVGEPRAAILAELAWILILSTLDNS